MGAKSDTRYSTEVLADLREHVVRLLRLDFGYLALAGAVVVALKIGTGALFEITSKLTSTIYFYCLLIAFDLYAAWLIHSSWLATKSGYGTPATATHVRNILYAQPVLHFAFILSIAIYVLGYSRGYNDAKEQIQARVAVEDRVTAFINRSGVAPKSMSELTADPTFTEIRKRLDGEDFRYEWTGEKTYRLTFAGWDKKFDTDDDQKYNDTFRVRHIYELYLYENR